MCDFVHTCWGIEIGAQLPWMFYSEISQVRVEKIKPLKVN